MLSITKINEKVFSVKRDNLDEAVYAEPFAASSIGNEIIIKSQIRATEHRAQFDQVEVNGERFSSPAGVIAALSFIGNFKRGGGTPSPTPALQSKAVSITENGTVKIFPDSGYDALSNVTANVDIPSGTPKMQEKSVNVIQNGLVSVTADAGYDGLSKVTANVNIPVSPDPKLQAKTIDITENGTIEVTPAAGYDGLSKVTASVSVGGPDPSKPVLFLDYDGTLLYSYTLAEAQALTALPAQPVHDLLTADGWTHTLAVVKATTTPLHVGAQYKTTDGRSHIQISLTAKSGRYIPIYVTISGTATIRVNWGDGTSTQNITKTSTVSHTYSAVGKYDITFERISGTGTYSFGKGGDDGWENPLVPYDTVWGNIEEGWFWAKQAVRGIYLGSNISAAINDYAFNQFQCLDEIVIPRGITSTGDSALSYNDSLDCIILPSGVTTLGMDSLQNWRLHRLVLPDSITTLGDYSISDVCTGNSLVIPAGITNFPTGMLLDGNDIFELTLRPGFPKIPQSFSYGLLLKSLTIPSSVTSIGEGAFQSVRLLREMIFERTTPPSFGQYFINDYNSQLQIYVPNASVNAYKSATNMQEYANMIFPISQRP